MPNIPKLRLMLARMEKSASRWRTVQGLTALVGGQTAAMPRLAALQMAASKQSLKMPGEGFAAAMKSLPQAPVSAPGLTQPTQVFRGVPQPAALINGGYSPTHFYASPFKEVAESYGLLSKFPVGKISTLAQRSADGSGPVGTVYQPSKLVGSYGVPPSQRYAPEYGFQNEVGVYIRGKKIRDQIDLTKGTGYARAKLQDIWNNNKTPFTSSMYETPVKPSQLQSVLLDDRVLPATAKGRELLQTGTMPAGAKLPPEILKSAAVTKEELIHAYKANDPAMRILSQSPVLDKDFLYHASGKKFDALDPKYNSKRSYGHEYTEPVVFAGDAPSSAFASNPTAEYQAVKDKMKDSVYHRLIDELTGRKALLGHTPGGYLYKLPASAFTRIDREDNELGKWNKSTEYVSHRPVKPISVTPMQSTDVDAIPEYEYLGKDFVGEMPAQHYLKHAKNPKVIAAIQAWLANKQEKEAGIADIANRVLSTLIKSPITPSFVKNTFYPGFPAVREALRATGRVKPPTRAYTHIPGPTGGSYVTNPPLVVKGENSDAYRALMKQVNLPGATPEGIYDKITTEMSGTPLQRIYSGNVKKLTATARNFEPIVDSSGTVKHWDRLSSHSLGSYHPGTNVAIQSAPKSDVLLHQGLATGTMRHELTHALQYQLPPNFNSLHTLSTKGVTSAPPLSGFTTLRGKALPTVDEVAGKGTVFLRELNANGGSARTPLNQITKAINWATDPEKARIYAPKYTPTEKWVHDTLSFPRDIPRRVKAMPGQLMDWIDSKILPPNLTKGAGVFTASGNKVQGVGLRKLYHSLLDERGLTGLGVNNEDTGDVELSFDGDEVRRKEVFKELAARIKAKTSHPVTFAPTTVPQTSTSVRLSNKDAERLNAIHHLAYRMSNMYDPTHPLMDPNDTFKQKLADRFRLQVNQRGLEGTVPSRAAEQLLGTRPMYAGMMPARRTRSEAEALSDMPMEQQQRLFKALKSGRGFLAPVVDKLASAAVEAPMNLYSYIPSNSIEHVKKHGLLSGNELAKPENRHLLDIARPKGDADRWLKERDARMLKSPWTNSYNGPSAFFGDIDAEKIHDKHPIKKFDTTRAVIKLRELLRDYPATKMEGSELIPFSDTTYDALDEKGQNEFVNKRHHTLSLDEIKALLTRGQNPKDMWKDFKDTEGKYYASDVPHAQVVTPMGKIPSKYIKFGDDVLTKHAGIAQLGMAAAKSLYGLGSAAVKSPVAQNIATGASNLVNRAGNLANTAMQSRAGKSLITGAENLHEGTTNVVGNVIQHPIVSRLYAGANKLTDAAIQSPMTPNFIKNTFKPGYEAGRQALRRTSRQWVPNWDAQAGFVPTPKRPIDFGSNSIHNSPDHVFRKYKAVNTPQLPPSMDGGYWNQLNQIAVNHPRGTESGIRVMRHELAHGLQYQLPSNFNSLQAASVNSPFAGSFLREMQANAAMSRTPLGQMGSALHYATSPAHLKAYWDGYKPIDKLMHGAAVGTAYGVPLAAATVAGGVGTYNGLHSLASRMQPTNLPHNPEFAQAGPPNLNTEESFPEEVA